MKINGAPSSWNLSGVKNAKNASPGISVPPATKSLPNKTDAVVLSKKADHLLDLRSISDLEKKQFQSILGRASEADLSEKSKAKEFLNSLSPRELDLVRLAHCLADPIDINSLSEEGARNLLVEPGAAQDLDNNGLTSVGKGNSFAFPPNNAPASFKKAWAEAIEGMNPLEIPMHLPFQIGLANIHKNEDGSVTAYEPGDPEWKNPYADSSYDYSKKIRETVAGIEYQHSMGQLSEARYQQEMGFYNCLKQGMAKPIA